MKRLLKTLLKNYKIQLLFVLLGIFCSAIATVIGTMFLQTLIDDFIIPLTKASNPDYYPLFIALLKIAGIYLIGIVSSYMYNIIMVKVSQGTMKDIRENLFSKMEALPIKFFDTHSHGDIMSVYTNDTDALRQFLDQSLPQLANSIITILSVLVSMLILNIPLTVISLILVAITILSVGKLLKISRKYFGKQQKDLGNVNGYIEEMIEGQKVVKVFNYEEENTTRFRKINEELRDSAFKANVYGGLMMPVSGQLGNLSYVICAIIGAALAINGYAGLTIGALVAFLTLNKNFNRPIGQISHQLSSVVMASAGIERIYKLIDEQPEINDGYVTLVNIKKDSNGNIEEVKEKTNKWAWKHFHQADNSITYTELNGNIVLEDVDFGYSDDKMILHDINLDVKSGQKVALVGSTGAGKTTITNLINRFYDIQNGKIRYDGINITKINKNDLRKSLGLVLQDTHLFTGTVMDNIRFGRLDATDEECMAAAKLANADSFISRLGNGYETVLKGDGRSLSEGQRQLLAIARAAVADPPALILDEATSSIDTMTETLIQKGMDKLMKGRTTFVIAHRLSTVQNSDFIVVLEDGRIIEKGTHDELLKEKGKYYQLSTGMKAIS